MSRSSTSARVRAASVRPEVYRAGAATQEETAVSVTWRSGRWTRSQWTAFPGYVRKWGLLRFRLPPRTSKANGTSQCESAVQQTLDAVVERLLLLHRVVEHLAKAGEGGVERVFKNARLLNTSNSATYPSLGNRRPPLRWTRKTGQVAKWGSCS